jgi:hypothetical protein
MRSNYSALNREQLDEIEREMQKHQFGSSEGSHRADENLEMEEDDEEPEKQVLDDESDEDYVEPSSTRPRRTATRTSAGGRNSQYGGGSASIRQPPRNSGVPVQPVKNLMHPRPSGFPGASILRSSRTSFRTAAPPPTGQPRRLIVNGHGPTTLYSGQPTAYVRRVSDNGEMRPYKVLRISRPPNHPGPGSGYRPMVPSESTEDIDREIEAICSRQPTRLIEGSTVQEFNDVIDQLSQELHRVIEDRRNSMILHREFVEQMNLSHATALDIKDSRIRQLEQTVDTLQNKLQMAQKRIQLNVLKHSADTAGHDNNMLAGMMQPAQHVGNPEAGTAPMTSRAGMEEELDSPNKILRADPMLSRQEYEGHYVQEAHDSRAVADGRGLPQFVGEEFDEIMDQHGHQIAL